MADKMEYAVLLRPLPEADGGGWEAIVPELPGCMSDGDTMAEAAANVANAIDEWKDAAEQLGRPIPQPGSSLGQWRQRVPKSLHMALKVRADEEGVSVNQLVTAILAQALGKPFGHNDGQR